MSGFNPFQFLGGALQPVLYVAIPLFGLVLGVGGYVLATRVIRGRGGKQRVATIEGDFVARLTAALANPEADAVGLVMDMQSGQVIPVALKRIGPVCFVALDPVGGRFFNALVPTDAEAFRIGSKPTYLLFREGDTAIHVKPSELATYSALSLLGLSASSPSDAFRRIREILSSARSTMSVSVPLTYTEEVTLTVNPTQLARALIEKRIAGVESTTSLIVDYASAIEAMSERLRMERLQEEAIRRGFRLRLIMYAAIAFMIVMIAITIAMMFMGHHAPPPHGAKP